MRTCNSCNLGSPNTNAKHRGAVQKNYMSAKDGGWGQNRRPLRKCKFLLGKNKKCLECKNMQKKSEILLRVSAKTCICFSYFLKIIFPSQPDIFLLQNHPFQAFLVSKTYILYMKKKNLNFCSYVR